MRLEQLRIAGAWIIHLNRFGDDRGWFQEWFKTSALADAGGPRFVPVQANTSRSAAGVIRGIHYSIAANGQGKLVTVQSGAIDDYVIDVRTGSPTFGEWERISISADEPKAILIDPHLAHAFQALEDNTVVSYLVTAEFDPQNEKAISPFCSTINIPWSSQLTANVSDKDIAAADLPDQAAAGLLPRIS
jgi:dTDP-4-dehydrorhamnose 3,5-epimerase